MIKSVLVAGAKTDDNLIVRYCEDLLLKTEHIHELGSKKVPDRHDAAIIAATAIGHHAYNAVKECYSRQKKPIFMSKNGVSNIKESFEAAVFGSSYILSKLREPTVEFKPKVAPKVLPVTARFWWVLCRFIEQGEVVKYKDIKRLFDKFLIKDQESALSNCWHKGKEGGYLEGIDSGVCRFLGIPENCSIMLEDNELPIEERFIMRSKVGASPNAIIIKKQPSIPFMMQFAEPVAEFDPLEEEPETLEEEPMHVVPDVESNEVPTSQSSNTDTTLELLLESMASQQNQIMQLQNMIETRIPSLIQNEIRGITKLLGSLVPKLQGLEPHEIEKVDTMIELFLSMRGAMRA